MPTMSETVFKSGHQSPDNPMEFTLSTEHVDRMGDIIRQDGWDIKSFQDNPIALYGHDHEQVIGIWENVRVEGKQLMGALRLAKEGTSEFIDTVRSLINQNILKSVSVGFQPIEANPRKSGGFDFVRSALHEVSVVAVPANAHALAVAKAMSPEIASKLFVQPDPDSRDSDNGQSTHTTETPNLEAARSRLKAMGLDY
jgi:HK97 family phage prohead protease